MEKLIIFQIRFRDNSIIQLFIIGLNLVLHHESAPILTCISAELTLILCRTITAATHDDQVGGFPARLT